MTIVITVNDVMTDSHVAAAVTMNRLVTRHS